MEEMNNNINKDDFIFGNFVLGLKGIPYNTEVLLVNNFMENTLDLVYTIDNNNQTIKVPVSDIKSISNKTNVRMQSSPKKTESNETKSMLLSAVVFGGNPLLQLAGNSAFNTLFDGISNNYDKVNFNSYFEISIDTVIDGNDIKFIINTDTNPDIFIEQIKERI